MERKHIYILKVTRAVRFQGHIPLRFWGKCVLLAVYLINRMPTLVLVGKSSFEIFHKRSPLMKYTKVPRCLCYVTLSVIGDTFQDTDLPCVMIGYSAVQKGYLFFDLTNKTFFVSRNVTFREDVFPLKKNTRPDKSSLFAPSLS